jgi:hypothetical protein
MLQGFTVTGGFTYGDGGGMYNEYSSPTVTNCIFSGNTATYGGGGMFNGSSSPTLINCTFAENVADEAGGGMWNFAWCSPKVINCTFIGNTVNGFGGGIGNKHGGDPEVTNCTFVGNSAAAGGGMACTWASRPTVTNSVFTGNTADFYGGGMYNYLLSGPTVTNCTFVANTALEFGGGMHHASTEPLTVTNCVVWGNTPYEIGEGGSAPLVTYSDVQGGWPGEGNIDRDPMFVDPKSGDYRLSSGSPCIDAGDNTAVPEGVDTDLDGNPRFVDDPDTADTGKGAPPIVDMGAYEYQTGCPWDCGMPADGQVSVTDLLAMLAQWGGPGTCDLDGGGVSVTDLLRILAHWGPCP